MYHILSFLPLRTFRDNTECVLPRFHFMSYHQANWAWFVLVNALPFKYEYITKARGFLYFFAVIKCVYCHFKVLFRPK